MYSVKDSAERGLVLSKYRVFILFIFFVVLGIPNKFGP